VSGIGPTRHAHLTHLTAASFDVLVIGGGITGAGVALDAAARGYAVGLVEQSDFASGTSSRSTKLIHGGIRYLAKGQVQLVREALRERATLLHLAPWLVRPQPFLIPLYRHLRRPLGLTIPAAARRLAPLGIGIGLWGYDRFAGNLALAHRRLALHEVERLVPALVTDGLQAAYLYHDARADDVRLTHTVLRTARTYGALTVNYAKVTAFRYQQNHLCGVQIEDRLTGRTYEIAARHIINATGVWAERIADLDGPAPFRVTPSKGIHLVLRAGLANWRSALVIPETDDGRLLFVTPWAGHMLVGTTDEPYAGPLETPDATVGDISYLLDHVNRYLTISIGPPDVVGVFAGLRPLLASREVPSRDLAREHLVVTSPSGLISIVGGKLTSYRKMAEDAVDELVRVRGERRSSPTASLALDGTAGWEDARRYVAESDLSSTQQEHLVANYGAHARWIGEIALQAPDLRAPLLPDEPILGAEVIYACRTEMCVALADFMRLRSHLGVIADDAGASAVDHVGKLMATELGWDRAEVNGQREAWEKMAAHDRALRADLRRRAPTSLSRPGP
jgi:glycerol-3-phosphate dehydrogenase